MFESISAEEAIEALFAMYADDVYRFARYSIPRRDDARDVVQEVFMRAFRSWDTFRHDADPKTWLFHIAKNHIYDLLRKKRTEQLYRESHPPDLSDVSVGLDTLVEIEEAMATLKPEYRQVILLRSVEDLSVDQTAHILGWSRAKVKTTLHRALKELRELLGDEFMEKVGDEHES